MDDKLQDGTTRVSIISILIGLLIILALVYFAWPVWRASLPLEQVGNEAWNAFLADRFKNGIALYPPRDAVISNNYPPLSFILVAMLSKFGWSPIFIGRTLSIIATLSIAASIGVLIRLLGGGRLPIAVGVFWYLATMPRFFDSYVGMNDPNLFALALMMWGLTWCVFARQRGTSVVPAFVLMAIAGYYKNSLIAAPAAAFCWLFTIDKKAALRAGIAGAVAATACLAIFFLWFGADFIYQLTAPRVMSLRRVTASLGRLQFVGPALVISVWWMIADRKHPAVKFVAIFTAWGLFSHFLQQSGEGVSDNSEFELIAAIGVGLGLAFGRVMPALQMRRNQIAILVIVIARLVISDRLEPYLLVASEDFRRLAPEAIAVAKSETQRVANIPDPIHCSIQTVCFNAGKAFAFDGFWLQQRVELGLWTEAQRKAAIDAANIRFETIDPRADAGVFLVKSGAIRDVVRSWSVRRYF